MSGQFEQSEHSDDGEELQNVRLLLNDAVLSDDVRVETQRGEKID